MKHTFKLACLLCALTFSISALSQTGNWGNVATNNPTYTNGNVFTNGKLLVGFPSIPSGVKTFIYTNTDDYALKVRNTKFSNFPNQPRYGIHATVDDNLGKAPKYAIYGETTGAYGYAGFFKGQAHVSERFGISAESIYTKLQIGEVTESNINMDVPDLPWCSSYIGFNTYRQDATQEWKTYGGTNENGGAVIYGNDQGELNFVSLSAFPNSGQNSVSITDWQVEDRTSMKLSGRGNLTLYPDGFGSSLVVYNKAIQKDVFRVYGDGKIMSTEIEVKLLPFPDYVFNKDYNLMTLNELEEYISVNKHLPNMPSAEKVEEEGLGLGELNRIQVEKLEEMTLYLIEMNKRIEVLEEENKKLQKELLKK